MPDISAFGLQVQIRASITFPQGFTVTQFADDSDPLDVPSIQIKDKSMGLNGDLITWGKANPILATLGLIPDSDDDRNMAILFEANRIGKGKRGSKDVITMVVVYPDRPAVTLTGGAITDGMPMSSAASAGRKKSKPYAFAFENKAGG